MDVPEGRSVDEEIEFFQHDIHVSLSGKIVLGAGGASFPGTELLEAMTAEYEAAVSFDVVRGTTAENFKLSLGVGLLCSAS